MSFAAAKLSIRRFQEAMRQWQTGKPAVPERLWMLWMPPHGDRDGTRVGSVNRPWQCFIAFDNEAEADEAAAEFATLNNRPCKPYRVK